MSGLQIAREIGAAFIEVGNELGTGPLYCTIRQTPGKSAGGQSRPWSDNGATDPVDVQFLCIQSKRTERDPTTDATRETRVVKVVPDVALSDVDFAAALEAGIDPGWKVAVGVKKADVTETTDWRAIAKAEPFAPSGVALSFTLELAA